LDQRDPVFADAAPPAIPFNLQNYLYGLTPIRFWPYALTSWLAMLPGTFLYVYLGHIAGAAVGADRSRTAAEWAMLAVGLLATVVVTVYVTRLARRKLQEQMNEAVEEEASLVPEEAVQRAPGGGARLRGTVMLAAAALIMAAAAVALAANATAFDRWLTGLFGPPRVELKEAYGAAEAESNASEASFDHSALDALLRQYVDADGWVDYAGLQADQARLDAYLAAVADAPFDALGRDEKLALLINAYNAFTLKLIVGHLLIGSIMDVLAAIRLEIEPFAEQADPLKLAFPIVQSSRRIVMARNRDPDRAFGQPGIELR
jgi:hypothetical protein